MNHCIACGVNPVAGHFDTCIECANWDGPTVQPGGKSCYDCGGDGEIDGVTCDGCGGSGVMEEENW